MKPFFDFFRLQGAGSNVIVALVGDAIIGKPGWKPSDEG
jgi:hypothetical protein